MKVLVINSGSSSIKYKLFPVDRSEAIAEGSIERIGETESVIKSRDWGADGQLNETQRREPIADHGQGLKRITAILNSGGTLADTTELFGIGHRVVHGGETFREPTLIDNDVLNAIRQVSHLAPLHNPANLRGVEVALALAPETPQVAVFDTAFHQSLAPAAYHYALPHALYQEHGVRRYGFHGTSHHYVAKEAARHLGRPLDELDLITLHLGNGASATAIKQGRSIDTSMGLTPLEGLIMGTRSGDLDPAIPFFLGNHLGHDSDRIERMLNKESGLKGICGVNDMREVRQLAQEGDANAKLALEMVCHRLKKYIGAYFALLGRLDALIFTAGIGEHDAEIRRCACSGLERLGLEIDGVRNNALESGIKEIQSAQAGARIVVIPTNEELEIARQTVERIRRA